MPCPCAACSCRLWYKQCLFILICFTLFSPTLPKNKTNKKKLLTLLLESNSAKDLVCLIVGYYRLFVDANVSIFTWGEKKQQLHRVSAEEGLKKQPFFDKGWQGSGWMTQLLGKRLCGPGAGWWHLRVIKAGLDLGGLSQHSWFHDSVIAAGLWGSQTEAWGEGSPGSCPAAPGVLLWGKNTSQVCPCWLVSWQGLSPLSARGSV